uniref:Putative major histocompatibility complex protein bat4 n=1 Tax=Ixodes ricinus TaxID=34613 RepID=V5HQY3_IXORI
MSRFKSVTFIRSREGTGADHAHRTQQSSLENATKLSGDTARQIYEEIISLPSTQRVSCTPTPRKRQPTTRKAESQSQPSPQPVAPVKASQLFTAAQNNDVAEIERCLAAGLDVNETDCFGWTPLMSAACDGAQDSVRFLLKRNADRRMLNKQGKTAMDLAVVRGHFKVVQLLCKTERGMENNRRRSDSEQAEPETHRFCDACRRTVTSSELSNHDASIVHQLSSGCCHGNRTHYGIPESNAGFRMLLGMGWNRERGFGPQESGRKFPVKTVLKRDRCGLGVGETRARVTHFAACDASAVERVDRKAHGDGLIGHRKKTRKEREREADKWRRKEIAFRREFH